MQETEISPLQSLTCRFVSQFVPVVKEVERDRGAKSERLLQAVPNPPSLSARCRLAHKTPARRVLMNGVRCPTQASIYIMLCRRHLHLIKELIFLKK